MKPSFDAIVRYFPTLRHGSLCGGLRLGLPATLLAWGWALFLGVAPRVVDGADSSDWESTLAIGFNLTQGNSETILSTASLTGKKETGRHTVTLGVEGAYGEDTAETADGETERQTTSHNIKGTANWKRRFNGLYEYLDAGLLHDRMADVTARLIAGPGLGYPVYTNATASFSIEAGISYVWEEVGGEKDDYPAFRLAERYEWKIGKTAKIWHTGEIIPKMDDVDNFLFNAELGAEAALNARFNLRLVIQDKHDSEPAEDKDKNDLTVNSALTWKL